MNSAKTGLLPTHRPVANDGHPNADAGCSRQLPG
jgi:hypothetical protein